MSTQDQNIDELYAKVASDSAAARAELDKRIAILEWRMNKAGK